MKLKLLRVWVFQTCCPSPSAVINIFTTAQKRVIHFWLWGFFYKICLDVRRVKVHVKNEQSQLFLEDLLHLEIFEGDSRVSAS